MLRARHYTTHIHCICYYVQGRGRLGAPPSPDRCRLTKRGETRFHSCSRAAAWQRAEVRRQWSVGAAAGEASAISYAPLFKAAAALHVRLRRVTNSLSALLGATAAIVGNSCNGAQLTDVKKKGQITFLAEIMSIFSYLM